MQPICLSLPTTYWLEGMRRALMGPLPPQFARPARRSGATANWPSCSLATTAALVLAAQLFWRWSERRAWRNGNLEENAGVVTIHFSVGSPAFTQPDQPPSMLMTLV